MTKRIKLGIAFAIEIVLVIVVGVIIAISLSKPQHNLFSWQMCIGTICFFSAIVFTYLLWMKIIVCRLGRWNDILFVAGLLAYFAFLYVMSIAGRNSPSSVIDYYIVYSSAEEITMGIYSDIWNYFLTYPNNFKPAMYLGKLFKVAHVYFEMEDPYPFALIFYVMQVILAIIATRYLSGKTKEERKRNQCLVLGLYMCLLPIIGNVQSFYTDSMSFCFAVVTIALLVYAIRCFEEKRKKRAVLCSVCGGSLLALGITIKVTVLIPCIAGIIIWIFYYQKKSILSVAVMAVAAMCLTYIIVESEANSYEIYQRSYETGNPLSSWVALGMKADGSYRENKEFGQTIAGMSTKEEKQEYTRQYIAENVNYMWDVNHLYQKIRCNFASGNLGLKDATYYPYTGNGNNIVWELFAPYGKYYWRTSQINFSYVFGIWTIYFVGGLLSIVSLIKRKEIARRILWVDLSLIGLFLFLMIWEANNRQLYNQMPVFLLGAVYHLMHLKSGCE